MRTQYGMAALLIAALAAPALFPGGIQTAQAGCHPDETAQFTEEDANGWTALHYAAVLNCPSLAKRLLESGVKVNAKLKIDGKLFTKIVKEKLRQLKKVNAKLKIDGKPFTEELKETLRRFGKDYDDWTRDGQTPLHIAAKENAHETATLLLEKGAKVNAKTDDGMTPLDVARKYSADETAALLNFTTEVGRPPSPTAKDANDWTDLHYAAALDLTSVAKRLLQSRAKVDAGLKSDGEPFTDELKATLHRFGKDYAGWKRDGQTPLHIAAKENAHETAALLYFTTEVERPPSPTAKDANDWTDLHYAAALDLTSVAKRLLQSGVKADVRLKSDGEPFTDELKATLHKFGKDYDGRNRYGGMPLHYAARENARETADLLLEEGADVNAKDNEEWTPLHYATIKNAHAVTKLLLDKGADVNARDEYDWTPLHQAAWYGARNVAELLLDKGADVNARDEYDRTPLYQAAWYNARDVAELLLDKGVDVNARDEDDWTPLHIAARHDAHNVAELLLNKGADVNARDKDDRTPLYQAAWYDARDVAELLLDKGADVNARDEDDRTPLHIAARHDAHNVAELLLNKGADVNARDEDGDTPLDFAADETAVLLRLHGGRSGR